MYTHKNQDNNKKGGLLGKVNRNLVEHTHWSMECTCSVQMNEQNAQMDPFVLDQMWETEGSLLSATMMFVIVYGKSRPSWARTI